MKKLNRDSLNEYLGEVDGKQVRIHTRCCHACASRAHGTLTWRGWSGSRLHIVEESFGKEKVTTCDVDELWMKVK